MKFSTKVEIVTVIVVILFGVGVSQLVYYMMANSLNDEITKKYRFQAESIVREVDTILRTPYQDVQLLAADKTLAAAPLDLQSVSQLLNQRKDLNTLYASLSFFSLNRVRLFDTSGIDIGAQHPLIIYWQKLTSGEDLVVDVSKSVSLKKYVLHFASLVKDKRGGRRGYVVLRVPIETVYGFIEKAGGDLLFTKSLNIDVIDNNGTILYSNYNKAGMMKEAMLVSEWKTISSIQGTSGNYITSDRSGERALVVFAREQGYLDYKGNNWIVRISIPTKIAFAPADRVRNAIFIALLVFGATYIFAIIFLLEKRSKPLNQLQNAVREIAKGNFNIQLEAVSNDEVGKLMNAFNQMARYLHDLTADLRTTNTVLQKEFAEHKRADAEKKKLWEKLVQSEKLAAIGELSSEIAHEIRNPISVIWGFAQGLMRDKNVTDADYIPIRAIEAESLRSKEYLDGLLAFSRTGKITKEKCDLNTVIDSVSMMIETKAKGKSVEIVKEFSADLPCIQANRTQMQQLVVNLCNNAIDAMPGGGILKIRTSAVLSNGKPHVEIDFKDTGMGIPEEIASRIFEPFYTTKEEGKGTGLGLALVSEIVKKHEGTIKFKSEVGKGTKFTLHFPA